MRVTRVGPHATAYEPITNHRRLKPQPKIRARRQRPLTSFPVGHEEKREWRSASPSPYPFRRQRVHQLRRYPKAGGSQRHTCPRSYIPSGMQRGGLTEEHPPKLPRRNAFLLSRIVYRTLNHVSSGTLVCSQTVRTRTEKRYGVRGSGPRFMHCHVKACVGPLS